MVASHRNDQTTAIVPGELYRVLRPCGGELRIACSQARGGWDSSSADCRWALPENEISVTNKGIRVSRGSLPGSGQWTHQYGDPGKRAASDERRVRLPLKAAWFGGLGPATILSRHFRTPAPLVTGGRCFVPGLDHLTAIDIYNGRTLWQRSLPDVAHWPAAYRGSGVAVDETTVYALQGRNCLLLDPATGETRATFAVPREAQDSNGKEPIWEYLAVTDELLIGTTGQPNIKRSWWSRAYPDNQVLFALEKRTGQLRWIYRAEEGIDSNAIAIDDGCRLLDRRSASLRLPSPGEARRVAQANEQPRRLSALDLANGRVLWQQEDACSVPELAVDGRRRGRRHAQPHRQEHDGPGRHQGRWRNHCLFDQGRFGALARGSAPEPCSR